MSYMVPPICPVENQSQKAIIHSLVFLDEYTVFISWSERLEVRRTSPSTLKGVL